MYSSANSRTLDCTEGGESLGEDRGFCSAADCAGEECRHAVLAV